MFAGSHGDFLALLVEHVRVGLQLEIEIANVDHQKNNCSSARQRSNGGLRCGAEFVKTCGDYHTADREREQAGCCLRYCLVEELL